MAVVKKKEPRTCREADKRERGGRKVWGIGMRWQVQENT